MMKNYIHVFIKKFSFGVGLIILIMLSNCGSNGSEPGPAEHVKSTLINGSPWLMESVIKDGYDVSDEFSGFTLTFTANGYATQKSLASAWPSDGNWEFLNNDPTKIVRDNDVTVDVDFANDKLLLSFRTTDVSSGRLAGIEGDYLFTLISSN